MMKARWETVTESQKVFVLEGIRIRPASLETLSLPPIRYQKHRDCSSVPCKKRNERQCP